MGPNEVSQLFRLNFEELLEEGVIFTPKFFWLAPKTSFLGLHFLGIVGDALKPFPEPRVVLADK